MSVSQRDIDNSWSAEYTRNFELEDYARGYIKDHDDEASSGEYDKDQFDTASSNMEMANGAVFDVYDRSDLQIDARDVVPYFMTSEQQLAMTILAGADDENAGNKGQLFNEKYDEAKSKLTPL